VAHQPGQLRGHPRDAHPLMACHVLDLPLQAMGSAFTEGPSAFSESLSSGFPDKIVIYSPCHITRACAPLPADLMRAHVPCGQHLTESSACIMPNLIMQPASALWA
jgi:hypothetical protein